jgi:BASS family bile acid:Na+ symporter
MNSIWQPLAVVAAIAFAVSLRHSKTFRGYQFTAWIVAAVTAAMIYPSSILHVGGFDMRNKWLLLVIVQLVMFGMGTQMSLEDFKGVAKSPRGVLVGIFCHFSVMPLVGFALIKVFHFEPEIAAGIILIGSCSSGLASNVMAYIAKSNLALSVTVTAVTTLLAPVMTPLWMKLLAGQLVEIKFFQMMMEIIKIVLVPIAAALLHDYLKHASPGGRRVVTGIASFGAVWLVYLALGGWSFISAHVSENPRIAIGIFGFMMAAALAGVVYNQLARRLPMLEGWMPRLSMFGIVYFTLVTTAAGRDNLLKIGLLLFVAAAIHNLAGYFFGYWLSRASGLDRNSGRVRGRSAEWQHGVRRGERHGYAWHHGPRRGHLQPLDERDRIGARELLGQAASGPRPAGNRELASACILKSNPLIEPPFDEPH